VIYLFYGSDSERARRKAFDWVAAARLKEPNLTYVRLAREELTSATLEEVSSSGTLFAKRLLALLDDPFAKVRAAESEDADADTDSPLDAHLVHLAESENVIVILAPGLASAKAKKIEALATKAYEFALRRAPSEIRGFNSALVNALAERSGEKLWVEIARALEAGDAPEQIHGLLHWKARDLMEKGSRSWTPAEARTLSLDLIALLSESRRTGEGVTRALERFALGI
jgi:hypothetical protein